MSKYGTFSVALDPLLMYNPSFTSVTYLKERKLQDVNGERIGRA